jgi:hypothetical protein
MNLSGTVVYFVSIVNSIQDYRTFEILDTYAIMITSESNMMFVYYIIIPTQTRVFSVKKLCRNIFIVEDVKK